MDYLGWLVLVSAAVAGAERMRPARPAQRALRPGLAWDAAMFAWNAHPLGVLLAWAAAGLPALPRADVAAAWPWALQAFVAIVGLDLAQYFVHRLLHAVPLLWRFHQVHHAVQDGEMDWVVSFRFHWFEAVVYRAAQALPLALLGFSPSALLAQAVVGTLVGHLNHANLDLGRGRWTRLLNSPRMHLWHHADDGLPARNFAVIFSAWDWLFGTASLPDTPPPRLGFPGDAAVPKSLPGRLLWPLTRG